MTRVYAARTLVVGAGIEAVQTQTQPGPRCSRTTARSRARSRAIRFDFTVNADFSITMSRIPCAVISVRLRSS